MLDKAAILVYNIPVDEIVTCGSGGTGRRARLRGVWFTPYGFKSRFPHKQTELYWFGFFVFFGTYDRSLFLAKKHAESPSGTPLPLDLSTIFVYNKII